MSRVLCMADKHAHTEVAAQRFCRGESWQDRTLYFCNGCAKEHEATSHHQTEPIERPVRMCATCQYPESAHGRNVFACGVFSRQTSGTTTAEGSQ